MAKHPILLHARPVISSHDGGSGERGSLTQRDSWEGRSSPRERSGLKMRRHIMRQATNEEDHGGGNMRRQGQEETDENMEEWGWGGRHSEEMNDKITKNTEQTKCTWEFYLEIKGKNQGTKHLEITQTTALEGTRFKTDHLKQRPGSIQRRTRE